jgi:hypothetical protein
MLILMALYIANWWKGLVRIESLGRYVWEFVAPIGKRFMPVVRTRQAFALGSVWVAALLIITFATWQLWHLRTMIATH